MPRMKILNEAEQALFDHPPQLSSIERQRIFDLPVAAWSAANDIQSVPSKIGFLVSAGYFRSARRFFPASDFYDRDIAYVAVRLGTDASGFDSAAYSARTRQRHRLQILELMGFRPFDASAARLLETELDIMARSHSGPAQIFWRAVDWLVSRRVEIPTSFRLTEAVSQAVQRRGRAIAKLISQAMTSEVRQLLNDLFQREETAPGRSPYRLTLLKKQSQSTRPTKIRERLVDLGVLKELYAKIAPILSVLNFGSEAIRYFAGSVARMRTTDLRRRADDDMHVHLVAFIAHQYFRLHDNLVDVLLISVKTFENAALREHRDWCFDERKRHEQAAESLLDDLDASVFQILRQIREAVADALLSDQEKVTRIGLLVLPEQTAEEKSRELRASLVNGLADEHYFDLLESRSVRLQNQVGGILKAITFQADPSIADLDAAIARFAATDGNLDRSAPDAFLAGDERAAVWKDGKFRISLYKAFLFQHVAGAIKSGSLNLEQSHRRRPLESYLIDRTRWQTEREQLLERAGMTRFEDPVAVLAELDAALQTRFEDTNRAIAEGRNPHFKMLKGKAFRVSTPKQDEEESEPLRHFFPERHYVPLTEILATVNLHTGFATELRHLRQTHVRPVSEKILFAGVICLGCAIGSAKMAQISTSLSAAELDSAINWRFSLVNLHAANDRITSFMAAMELPNIYRRSENEIHTASDGQKFEVRADSLNANHSFKYFGKGQGISAYTFVDERNLFWHSLVFSAAERESAYVIDGLMRNDVVKSDIHSTDTHGFSEVIFAVTHLIEVTFAPRIKNLKKQSLYMFRSRRGGDRTGWLIKPEQYVDQAAVVTAWDDVLRLVVTIKLKESTASDIFRRLNSYSRQHSLYTALKAFGRIIKTVFILRYIDDVELRMQIENLLNRIELGNRFTRAVAVGNPREFSAGDKDEQEIAETCNRLIKNAIVCWNYLLLEHRLNQASTDEIKAEIRTAVANHSVISWGHVNLLGEYDFSDEKLRDSVGIPPPKIVPKSQAKMRGQKATEMAAF
jgi:TnpA family transposase